MMAETPLIELARVLDQHFVDVIENEGGVLNTPVPSWEQMGQQHQDNLRAAVRVVITWLNDNPDSWEELGLGRE